MFETFASSRSGTGRRRWPFLAGAAAVYAGLGALALGLGARRSAPLEPVIPVRIVAPRASTPGPPPAPVAPRPPTPPLKRRSRPTPRLVQPVVVPEVPAALAVNPEPAPEVAEVSAPAAAEGVVGGMVGGEGSGGAPPPPPEPVPARPADVASVRSAIARTLEVPALARRHGWSGKVVVGFVLAADGSVSELALRQSSGFKMLDEAALEAVRRAVPFPAPGLAVRVVIPLVFDVHG